MARFPGWGPLGTTRPNHWGSGGETGQVHPCLRALQVTACDSILKGRDAATVRTPLQGADVPTRLPSWPAPPRPGPSSETASKLPRCHHHLLPVFLLPRGWWPPWVTLAHSTSSSLCCLLGSQPLAGSPITVSLSKEAGCFWCPGGSLGDARGKRVSWQGAEDGAGRGACGAGSREAGGSKARPKAEGAGGVTG